MGLIIFYRVVHDKMVKTSILNTSNYFNIRQFSRQTPKLYKKNKKTTSVLHFYFVPLANSSFFIKAIFVFPKVIARQEDKPPTSAHVTIRVLDDNDNSPEFIFKNENDDKYFGIVEENAAPDRQILRVSYC